VAIEIERKFLVQNDQWREHVVSQNRLMQAYLCDLDSATVRVRISDDAAFLTIKSATVGICRSEFEYEIPVQDAESLLELRVSTAIIDKTRYKVKCGNHIWDLDLFHGENHGLVMAEIELGSEQEQFEMPTWAGEEVSDEPRYFNVNLVETPYSRW